MFWFAMGCICPCEIFLLRAPRSILSYVNLHFHELPRYHFFTFAIKKADCNLEKLSICSHNVYTVDTRDFTIFTPVIYFSVIHATPIVTTPRPSHAAIYKATLRKIGNFYCHYLPMIFFAIYEEPSCYV